jgi:hypothetical protein
MAFLSEKFAEILRFQLEAEIDVNSIVSQKVESHTKHSLHQIPPSPSLLAALSNLLPQPGSPFCLSSLPSNLAGVITFLPPQTRQGACQRVPWGPGTTPRSIGETAFWHPGHADCPPNRGIAALGWMADNGRSNLLDVAWLPSFMIGETIVGASRMSRAEISRGVTSGGHRTTCCSVGAHCNINIGLSVPSHCNIEYNTYIDVTWTRRGKHEGCWPFPRIIDRLFTD